MTRKTLIKYLESLIYPENSGTQSVSFKDEEGVINIVSLEELQKEFEKMLAELRRE